MPNSSSSLFVEPYPSLTDSPLTTNTATSLASRRASIAAPFTTTSVDFIGNTLETAHNIGDVNDWRFNWNDSVSGTDEYDFYRFRLDNPASFQISLTGMQSDADLRLLDSQGNLITYSVNGGNWDDSVNGEGLEAGIYYVQVNSYSRIQTTYALNMTFGGTALDPGATLETARDLGNISRMTSTCFEAVGQEGDSLDLYRFELGEAGSFNLSLSDLSSDIDVILRDQNGLFLNYSNLANAYDESIEMDLNAGIYYIEVYPWSGNSSYQLQISSERDEPIITDSQRLLGTLGADTFSLTASNLNNCQIVVSGNGNVDFGQDRWDLLDLSTFRSTDFTLNLATSTGEGLLYDPGNGSRVFDAISFSNGSRILFEGIDRIQFADGIYNLSVTTNDPYFSDQWNLHMMGVQNAWRFGTGSTDILIGIQDTGLGISTADRIHPDLRSPLYFDVDNLADEYFDDYYYEPSQNSHGTMVQSIISAVSNNSIGMSGINWNSPIYTMDVLDNNATDESLASATQAMINAANLRGQRLIVNMSLGGGDIEPEFRDLVANNQETALFVISTGNDDYGALSNPASLAIEFDNVIAVGAAWGRTDAEGNTRTPGDRISYDDWWGSNYGEGLTLLAPSEVIAADADYSYEYGATFDYQTQFNGTSAAAPNAAGVASLVWSANRNLTATQVQEILASTAIDLGTAGYDNLTGHGMINADAAVRRAIAIGRETAA